jgi:SAM-dependent methyltransferase
VSTEPVETFQIPLEIAETYESKFVPALFAAWAPRVAAAAGVSPGQSVLDVACGTGVVAREAADRVGSHGTVVGVDLNEAMLTVARRLRPDIDWRQGDACELPFPDRSFDVVLCQSALMFFPDRAQALREMSRVVNDHGTVTVQGWSSLDGQPAYGPLVEVAARHAGPEAVNLLGSYWTLGDIDLVGALFDAAGLEVIDVQSRIEPAHFESIDDLVQTEVESTPLVERIDDVVYERIRADARVELAQFRTSTGTAEIPLAGYIVTGHKR